MTKIKKLSINPQKKWDFLKSGEISDKSLDKTVQNVVQYLKEKKMKIATAESCTGGLLSFKITSVSGSSEVFDVGVCTYAPEMKTKILGVSPETIEKYNVVSRETASEMAEGLLKLSDANINVSVTGVAGPSGGTEEIPVGTVCFGFAVKGSEIVYTLKVNFSEYGFRDREAVRKAAACTSFCMVYEILSGVTDE